jgi:glycerophosphoryl diester phosphodiesterase
MSRHGFRSDASDPSNGVLISAHRGGSENTPAATYEAYTDALTSGAEYAEFDIRKLGDGSLVVYHDEHTPDKGLLRTLEYSEFCRRAGYEVPLVERVLKQMSGHLRGHLDFKEIGYEEEVILLTRKYLANDFIATSLEDTSLHTIKDAFPDVQTALSLGRDLAEFSRFAALAIRYHELYPRRRIKNIRADGIAVHKRIARLKGLALAKQMGIFAMVWTVDEDDLLQKFLQDDRVHILITNRPRTAVQMRAQTSG